VKKNEKYFVYYYLREEEGEEGVGGGLFPV